MSKKVPHSPAMSEEEIAKELGMTVPSVHNTLRKALKKLRDGRALKLKALAEARQSVARHELPRLVRGGL